MFEADGTLQTQTKAGSEACVLKICRRTRMTDGEPELAFSRECLAPSLSTNKKTRLCAMWLAHNFLTKKTGSVSRAVMT